MGLEARAQIWRGQVRDTSETPVEVLSPQGTSWISGHMGWRTIGQADGSQSRSPSSYPLTPT